MGGGMSTPEGGTGATPKVRRGRAEWRGRRAEREGGVTFLAQMGTKNIRFTPFGHLLTGQLQGLRTLTGQLQG